MKKLKKINQAELEKKLELHQMWLNDNPAGCQLDLSSHCLRNVNLKGSDLQYANIKEADLQGLNLNGCDLRYADISCSYLEGVKLEDADLEGANFYGAFLEGVTLYESNITWANFDCARIGKTILSKAVLDMSSADYNKFTKFNGDY